MRYVHPAAEQKGIVIEKFEFRAEGIIAAATVQESCSYYRNHHNGARAVMSTDPQKYGAPQGTILELFWPNSWQSCHRLTFLLDWACSIQSRVS
jgi:hypothetical protein